MSNVDTGTQLIFTDNPGALPAEYALPPKLNLKVSSVLARIDGSGAGGAFLPCLSIYSQDGHLMARVKADDTFQAGDTGVVTWAPFLRAPATSTPPPATGVTYFEANLNADFTVPYDTAANWPTIAWSSIGGTADVSLDGSGFITLDSSGGRGGTWLLVYTARFVFAGGATDFIAINFDGGNLVADGQSQIVDPTKGYTYNAILRTVAQLTTSAFIDTTPSTPVTLLTTVAQHVSNVPGNVILDHQQTQCRGWRLTN